MIPLDEWSLCHEYLQQRDWFVLGALAGKQMDAWLKSFHSAWKICPHPAVRLQPSGTECLSSNVSLFKSARETLTADSGGNWGGGGSGVAGGARMIGSIPCGLLSKRPCPKCSWSCIFGVWRCFSPWPSPLVHQPAGGGEFILEGVIYTLYNSCI